MNKFFYWRIFFLFMVVAGCRHQPGVVTGAVEARDAISTFQVADGFKIEMIASEPLISDPVDMEIDEYGRMYVVEMHGYPLDKSGSGKIILLSDSDGDGVMDKRTVFKENLMLPNSILRWKKGLLVTDSPNVLYLEDTDGDGQSNITDTVLHGFALTNPQHNMNSPVYGLDNWIYIANQGSVGTREYKEEFGDQGSDIVYYGKANWPKLPKNARGRSIRLRPDSKEIEMSSSQCQFGHTFDQWGHRFGCNNSNQGYQEVIADRYFARNPDLLIADATQSMSDHLDAAEVFPTTTHPDRQIFTNVGVMTSACGLTEYLGAAFPPPYDGNISFVAEPVSNLVHVDILKDSGSSFKASRILQNKEFLSSTDAWSRPVNMYVGPDGALYVLDYYRRVIESPEWMSEEVIKAGGLYDGADKGRIFRITPKGAKKADWIKGLKLGEESTAELVKPLADPNIWWRLNAQRLLVDRADKAVVPALIEMTKNISAMGRLHALWTLEGLGELNSEQIGEALRDSVAGIRENAIQLAEIHLKKSPGLAKNLLNLQNDADAKVRFQLLLTLGFINSPESSAARNKILFEDINDKWVQYAALTAPSSQSSSLLKEVLAKYSKDVPAFDLLIEKLTTMIGVGGNERSIHQLIEKGITEKRAAIIQGISEGLENRKTSLPISLNDQKMLVKNIFNDASSEMRKSSLKLLKINSITDSSLKNSSVKKAVAIMTDRKQSPQKRAEAIEFIGIGDPAPYSGELKKYIVPSEEPLVQAAALHTLSKVKGTAISEYAIQQWALLTPEIRNEAVNTFMVDSQRMAMLIDAMEKDKIKPESVDFGTSVQIMLSGNDDIRNRARALFTKNEKERKKINKEYQESLNINGNGGKGKIIYQQHCAICHQVRGKTGVAIGPDLGTIHNWIKEDILANILDPNLSISSGFDMWEAQLNNGQSVQGIIAGETPSAILLRNNGKLDRAVNRQDIKVLRSMNMSAMPTGFEKKISRRQMADLLAFLRQN